MPSTTRPNDPLPTVSRDDLDDVMAPDMSDEEAAGARPIREAPAGLLAALPKNRGGRPRSENPKEHVSLRLDPHVIEAYRATGPGWQARINETLARGAQRLTRAKGE